jgi:hypothetical protein
MAEWLTIEVVGAGFPASRWRRAHEDALLEAALAHGVSTWEWHGLSWGVVLELLFDDDERLERYRRLPAVTAALDAVPDRASGLAVYRGRGGGSGARVPRRPSPLPRAGAAAWPDPLPELWVELASGRYALAGDPGRTSPASGPRSPPRPDSNRSGDGVVDHLPGAPRPRGGMLGRWAGCWTPRCTCWARTSSGGRSSAT